MRKYALPVEVTLDDLMTLGDIARMRGESVEALIGRLVADELKSRRKEQLNTRILEFHQLGYSDAEISRRTGAGRKTIEYRRRQMGLIPVSKRGNRANQAAEQYTNRKAS